jgi:hypothetical protein
MPSTAILRVAQTLHEVSDRLDQLADEHEEISISTALTTISGNIRHTATLLEVLVVTKLGPPEPGPANA